MVKKKIRKLSESGVSSRVLKSQKEKGSYLALLAMTRLFMEQKIPRSPNLNQRFILVMESFLVQKFCNFDEIRPHLHRIEAFLTENIEGSIV
jgi:hypothetical protein